MIKLPRNKVLTIVQWTDDEEFIGTVEDLRRGGTSAAYGWSKGAGFFVYEIGHGHIEKLGTVKRAEILGER